MVWLEFRYGWPSESHRYSSADGDKERIGGIKERILAVVRKSRYSRVIDFQQDGRSWNWRTENKKNDNNNNIRANGIQTNHSNRGKSRTSGRYLIFPTLLLRYVSIVSFNGSLRTSSSLLSPINYIFCERRLRRRST
jgi:hypothetical protein